MHLSCSVSIMHTAVYNATGREHHSALLPLDASRSSAINSCASVSLIEMQVNEALSDSPADLLDFSMKQELEQVHHTMLHLGMHSFQCWPFLICSKPCSCLDVHQLKPYAGSMFMHDVGWQLLTTKLVICRC